MLSDLVADQIRVWRKRRGWNRQRLAAECAQRGMPELTFDSISNIEGRRTRANRPRTVTVDELVVIAHALNVPPAILVCPYPEQPTVELLPGRPVPSYVAVEWFAGVGIMEADIAPDAMDAYGDAVTPLLFLRLHSYLQALLRAGQHEFAALHTQREQATGNAALYLAQRADALTCRLDSLEEDLVKTRFYLTERGYPLPDLIPDLSYLANRKPDSSGPVETRYEIPIISTMEDTNP